jgi:hypothetical protein
MIPMIFGSTQQLRKGVLVFVLVLAAAAFFLLRRDPAVPTNSDTAKQVLEKALAKQRLLAQGKRVKFIPTTNSILAGLWVFGVANPEYERLGGARYEGMYLVGSSIVPSPNRRTAIGGDAAQFIPAFRGLLSGKAIKSESEALDAARCAAALLSCTSPDQLRVLANSEVPPVILNHLTNTHPDRAQELAREISGPKTETHRIPGASGVMFTVEFYAYLPESWGDINFWHVEIGSGISSSSVKMDGVFSVSQRPVYFGLRVLQ